MSVDKIEKISQVGKKIAKQIATPEPNKDYFESLIKQRRVSTEATVAGSGQDAAKVSTLFDEVRNLNKKVDNVSRSSPSEIASQADSVVAQIDELKTKLETPNLELKGSVQTVLRDKLSHIDESLKIALERAGVEYKPPPKSTSLHKPMERFLNLLTHSQSQLESLTKDLQGMAVMGTDQLNPATMLLVQVKVNHISQQIELFTSLLNKALESTKTIMNVQV